MACFSTTAYRSPVVERLLDLLAAVRKLCGKKHLAAFFVHNGDPGGPAPRIEFEAERLYLRLLDGRLEDEGKRVPFQHGCFADLEQEACSAWMQRGEWLPIGIDEKNETHWMAPLLLTEPPDDPGNVCLDNVQNGLTCKSLA
jgi:hypothetical protein